MFNFLRRPPPGMHRLAEASLFSDLTHSDLKTLEGFMHRRHYLPGEIIFDQGEEGQALYVIITGQVLICYPGQMETPIAELGPGNFFGELALLDNSPRTAQARARGDTELAAFFRGDFERLMESHARIASRVALQLARNIGTRMRQAMMR